MKFSPRVVNLAYQTIRAPGDMILLSLILDHKVRFRR
jgi:hypothetical protein